MRHSHSHCRLIVVCVAAMGCAATFASSGPPQTGNVSGTTPEENMGTSAPMPSDATPAQQVIERVAPVSAAVEVIPGDEDEGAPRLGPPAGSNGTGSVSGGNRGEPPPNCGIGAGSCFLPNGSPGCNDVDCCGIVCDIDDFCCIFDWDAQCAGLAWDNCEPPTDVGACCDENDDCVGVMLEADCAGSWYAGWTCEGIVCSSAAVDLCPGDSIEIDSSTLGSTITASVDAGLPWCGTAVTAPGVWYTVIGNGHALTATTCNAYTDYDSKINVYCDSCAEPNCVVGNDDSCSEFMYRSTVHWCTEVGAEYFILVQGYSNAVGNFQLDVVDQGTCNNPVPGCRALSGACCDGLTCTGNTEPDLCEGAWYGSQDCDTFECPTGACCSNDSVCTGPMGQSDCVDDWFPGRDCDTFVCPVGDCGNGTCGSEEDCASCEVDCGPCPWGACCEEFACTETFEPDCPGTWVEGVDCATHRCPFGACCEESECSGNSAPDECAGEWHFSEDCATFECPEDDYCRPCYLELDDDYITNVTFVTIDNTTGQEGACRYGDHTYLSTTVEQGSSHQISVTFYSEDTWTECVKVWVDWNRDFVFDASESHYLGCGVETTLTGEIDVPLDAVLGCTRMRVIEEYLDEPVGACNTESPTIFGEAEDYSVCTVAGCPAGEIEWLDPRDDVVDAGVPSDGQGGPLLGIDQILVSAPAGAGAECFTFCENDDGGFGPNSIAGVTDNGDGTYTIDLSRPLTPMAVTTITYTATNSTGRFTTHPANANADAWSGPIDILSLIDYLNGVEDPPHGSYSVDVDRSGVVDAADIGAVIDLLNGAEEFPPYLETARPVNNDCP